MGSFPLQDRFSAFIFAHTLHCNQHLKVELQDLVQLVPMPSRYLQVRPADPNTCFMFGNHVPKFSSFLVGHQHLQCSHKLPGLPVPPCHSYPSSWDGLNASNRAFFATYYQQPAFLLLAVGNLKSPPLCCGVRTEHDSLEQRIMGLTAWLLRDQINMSAGFFRYH